MKDVIEVPQECSSLVGYYAISENGMREMLAEDIRKETDCTKRIEAQKLRADIAEEQAKQYQKVAKQADWWSRYGFILGLGTGTVAAGVVGVVVGIFAGRLR